MEYIKYRLLENLIMVSGKEIVLNALLGLLTGAVASVLLYRGAKKEDSLYSFHKKDALFVVVAALFGMVVFISPFSMGFSPMGKGEIYAFLSVTVCFVVLLVTSFMDEKTGMFTLGHLLVGALAEVILFATAILGKGIERSFYDLLLFFSCTVLVVLFGFFCYSLGDAGLMFLVCLAFFLDMEMEAFFLSMLFLLIFSAATFLVRYSVRMARSKNRKEERFPFTIHILIGLCVSLFLFS